MPHAFLLHLSPTHPTHPKDLSLYAHGLFYHLLETIDPNLSAAIHAAKRNPFTLWATQPRDEVIMRVTTLDDTLFKPLLAVVLEESLKGLALGQDTFHINKVLATPQGDKNAGYMSWPDILTGTFQDKLEFRFLTPTVFSTSRSDGKRHFTPLPLPRLILKSLVSSFQTFSPQPYCEEELAAFENLFEEYFYISHYELKTQPTKAGKTLLTGFTGKASIHYQDRTEKVKKLLGQLARLAFFSGLGAKTPYGLGQVRVKVVDN